MAGLGMKLGSRYHSNKVRVDDHLATLDELKTNYIAEVERFVTSDDCPSHYQYLLDNVYGEDNVEFS